MLAVLKGGRLIWITCLAFGLVFVSVLVKKARPLVASPLQDCGLFGDVNDSDGVDETDIGLVAGHWHAGYVPDYDLNSDLVINVVDVMLVASRWGNTADWYVCPQGSDTHNGRTPSSAFHTLGHALEVVQPGQTILLLWGTYHEFAGAYDLGSTDATIVIRGDVADQVLFDGQRTRGSAFQCWECVNIIVENLTIQNYRWEGLGVFLSRQITLRNLHIRDSGFAIHPEIGDGASGITVLDSTGVTIENNTLDRIGFKIIEQDVSGNGIDVYRCQNCQVRGNMLRSVIGTGILVEESCTVTVESNTVEDGEMEMLDWWDGGIWLDGGHDVVVRDNTFRNNHGPGIQVSDSEAVYPNGSYGFVLENNISQNNEFGMYLWNFGVCPPPENAVRMSGNTVSGNVQQDFRCVEWECGVGQPCVEPSGDPPC